MKNIVLIGFMGSGKTVVAKGLSKKLKMKIIDADNLIEKKAGMKIKTIFKKYGEEYFRDFEEKIIKEISKKKNIIISTGGGVIKRENNIKNLKKNGIVIYLKNTFKTACRRLKGEKNRPLFNEKNLKSTKKLFLSRLKLYERAADITIKTDNKKVNEVVGEIIKKVC